MRENVGAHLLRGRGGQRDDRGVGTRSSEVPQLAVGWTEFVAPLGHAVGLVDGYKADVKSGEKVGEPGLRNSLRGHIQQFDLARPDPAHHLRELRRCLGAVDEPRRYAVGLQRVDLVLHQRDQWRDHQRQAGQGHGRQLIAQRLPAARGHQRERVPPTHHRPDDVLLKGQEGIIAEVSLQQFKHAAILIPLPDRCNSPASANHRCA